MRSLLTSSLDYLASPGVGPTIFFFAIWGGMALSILHWSVR